MRVRDWLATMIGMALTAAATPAPGRGIAPDAAGTVIVANVGTTRITGGSGASRASAALVTRAAAPAEQSDGQVSRCSGCRVPCDLVTRLTLAVDGQAVAVPDRAVLLLADVNRGRLRALGAGRFVLELDCGDAAASYVAKLFFDRTRVERLEIWAGEANALAQVTVFHDPDRAFRGM